MPFDGSDFAGLGALDKIDRVIDLLSREEAWCKGKLRTDDGRRCIVGAMQDAQAVIELTRPVMLAIQQVARGRYSGIEAFNDHRATTHAQVMAVLHQARANVIAGIVGEPAAIRPAVSAGWFTRFLGWARAVA